VAVIGDDSVGVGVGAALWVGVSLGAEVVVGALVSATLSDGVSVGTASVGAERGEPGLGVKVMMIITGVVGVHEALINAHTKPIRIAMKTGFPGKFFMVSSGFMAMVLLHTEQKFF